MDEMLEGLYELDEQQLRRLAYEALLISDGPDRQVGQRVPEQNEHATAALHNLNDIFKEF